MKLYYVEILCSGNRLNKFISEEKQCALDYYNLCNRTKSSEEKVSCYELEIEVKSKEPINS